MTNQKIELQCEFSRVFEVYIEIQSKWSKHIQKNHLSKNVS